MPANTPFDNQAGTRNIRSSQKLPPGAYGSLSLPGGSKLELTKPGIYIFSDVKNTGNASEIVFDFGTASGTFNIYVVGDANWGKITVRMINGNSSRIFTEVHGNGSANAGNAFSLADGSTKQTGAGVYNWVGTVWAPNGAISIGPANNAAKNFVNVLGALWSGTKVNLAGAVSINYQVTMEEQNFVSPYYPPPVTGKVGSENNLIGSELFSLSENSVRLQQFPITRFSGSWEIKY
jgi:hypothetical protein